VAAHPFLTSVENTDQEARMILEQSWEMHIEFFSIIYRVLGDPGTRVIYPEILI
jgi:hypothetical protein